MPYSNMPDDPEMQARMESCVQQVMDKEGHDKESAIAICYAAIEEKDAEAIERVKAAGFILDAGSVLAEGGEGQPEPENIGKAGARNNRGDAERLQAIHDYAVENGATCKRALRFRSTPGNELKALSKTAEEIRVGNYIALFGGRDLTGYTYAANPDGTMGEYFTRETEFDSPYTKSGVLYVDFEHGRDPDDLGIGEHEILGTVDWKTARMDERGLFVERVLNRRNKYVQFLESLLDEGLLGNSSEALAEGVQKASDGHITRWPLKRDTITVNPMEPRMLSENSLQAIKALVSVMPELETLLDARSAPVGGESAAEKTIPQEKETMDESEVKALVESAATAAATAAADEAVKRMSATLPEVRAGYHLEVVEDESDKALRENPFKSFGEFLLGVKNAAMYPSEADKRLLPLKATGANENIPSQGGFLVQQDFSSQIYEAMTPVGSLLSQFNAIPVSGGGLTIPAVDETSRADGSRLGGVQGYWLAEGATITASKPKFRQIDLKLKKVAALVYATDELLEDAGALQSWIMSSVPNELRFKVEDAIMNGSGAGRPQGIHSSPALVSVGRYAASAVGSVDIGNLWARRYTGVNDYIWTVNSAVYPQLMQMSISNQPVYTPADSLAEAPYGKLLGRPVIETEYNSALGTAGDITLISPSQYALITKGGIKSEASIHVAFTTAEQAFRFIARYDGEPYWKSALTPFKGSNDISPFVTLSASTG